MNSKFAKELFIILLLVIVIMFTIGVLFYDCLPISSERIKSAQYQANDEVKQTLNEVQENSGINGTTEDNSLLKSYSIDKNDLNAYASDKSYESGKKDPFAETSEPVEEIVTTTTTGATTNNSQSANPMTNTDITDNLQSTNPTSNTGTFFENENSK
jgi:flagellar basal body-associated protein FliL